MELIFVPSEISRLQGRDTAFRCDLKYSAIESRLFLVKISELRGDAPVPSRRRTEQAAKIDIHLFHPTAHPAFGQSRELVDRINRYIHGASANVRIQ